MKIDDYKQLCALCDKVLKKSNFSESRVSISWLHILKSHPYFLKNYSFLFTKKNVVDKQRIFFQLIKYTSISFYKILSGIFFKKVYLSKPLKNPDTDFLIVSHIENKELIHKKNDFYFGEIPKRLKEKNFTSTIAMVNHVSINENMLPKNWEKSEYNRMLLSRNLSFFEEIEIYFQQLKESLSLKKLKSSNELYTRICREASIQALASNTANNIRLKKQISKILKIVNPKYIMVAFEGHAHERLIFSEAKKINSNISCIAYQHALINGQYAVYRSLGQNYDPDIIATSGEIDLMKFTKKITNNEIKKIKIGSSKKIPFQEILNKKTLQKPLTCLILADGIEEECAEMLLFASSLASKNIETNFIFRMHPRTNKSLLLNKNPSLKQCSSNISWSFSPLEVDYKNSDIAVYRGTNAIFEAVSFGVLPVFFNNGNGIEMDPLSDLFKTRPSMKQTNDFREILRISYSKEFYDLIKLISDYCNKKYEDLDIKQLTQILSN